MVVDENCHSRHSTLMLQEAILNVNLTFINKIMRIPKSLNRELIITVSMELTGIAPNCSTVQLCCFYFLKMHDSWISRAIDYVL